MARFKAFIEKLEDVDEKDRAFYVPDKDHEGKDRFKLDAEGLEDVGGLKVVNSELKTKLGKQKARLEAIEDIEDLAELPQIIELGKAEAARVKSGQPRDDIENVKKQMNTAHTKELGKVQKDLAAALTALEEQMIENVARTELNNPDEGIKGNTTLMLPHIKGVAKIVRVEDGDTVKFETRVLDPKTKKERVDSKGDPIGIKALVAEFSQSPEFEGAFEGTGASGSGTPSEGSRGTPTPSRTPANPPAERKTAKQRTGDYAI